jgi:hypothetical protein
VATNQLLYLVEPTTEEAGAAPQSPPLLPDERARERDVATLF